MTDLVDTAVAGRHGSFVRWYFLAVVAFGTAMMVALVVIMGVQVFFRYVLNDSLVWAEEICRYLLVWMTFLFAGAAFQRGEMISLELLLRWLPGAWRLVLLVPAYLGVIALLGALVWYGWRFAQLNSFQTIPAADFLLSAWAGGNQEAEVSIFWIYVSVPLGMALLGMHFILSLAAQITRALRGAPAATLAPGETVPPEGWAD